MALILSLLSPALLILAAADEPKGDHAKIQGKWQAVTMTNAGKDAADAQVKEAQIVFTETNMELHARGRKWSDCTYTLNPASTPKAFDMTPAEGRFKGAKLKGIYELDGDDLKLCIAGNDASDRPTEFKSPAKSTIGIFVLKRVK